MTLWISVFYVNQEDKKISMEFEPGQQLAGFEDSRYEFWGHPVMKSIGIKLLYQLGEPMNIVVEGESLNTLEEELHRIREHQTMLITETNQDADFINFHTKNLLNAVKRTKDVNGSLRVG